MNTITKDQLTETASRIFGGRFTGMGFRGDPTTDKIITVDHISTVINWRGIYTDTRDGSKWVKVWINLRVSPFSVTEIAGGNKDYTSCQDKYIYMFRQILKQYGATLIENSLNYQSCQLTLTCSFPLRSILEN